MILIIDTTEKECRVALANLANTDSNGEQKTKEIKWSWQKDTGTEVLANIAKLLHQKNKSLRDLQAILVNCGPGSFTGVRVGITIANTLGWSKNIPVYGFRNQKGELEKTLVKALKENKKNFSPALPCYLTNKI